MAREAKYSSLIFWMANDLMEILEDTYDECQSKKEDYYRQIALFHLLMGIPHQNKGYNKETAEINAWIYKLYPKIKEYRLKYSCGEI